MVTGRDFFKYELALRILVVFTQKSHLNVNADVTNRARGLNIGLSLQFVNVSNEFSGESAHLRRFI